MPLISRTTKAFRERKARLPARLQQSVRKQFILWSRDPQHPSVQFKHLRGDVWSARVNDKFRALAIRNGDLVTWFWVGSHAEYDRIVDAL